jgi:hypothetical protein
VRDKALELLGSNAFLIGMRKNQEKVSNNQLSALLIIRTKTISSA